MTDWSGRDYAEVSSLQRAMATEAVAALQVGDFGSREAFTHWCSVGLTAWTGRLPEQDRDEFVADQVRAYEPIAGRPGLFRFTQMRALLHR